MISDTCFRGIALLAVSGHLSVIDEAFQIRSKARHTAKPDMGLLSASGGGAVRGARRVCVQPGAWVAPAGRFLHPEKQTGTPLTKAYARREETIHCTGGGAVCGAGGERAATAE